jgi:hypothetical protein
MIAMVVAESAICMAFGKEIEMGEQETAVPVLMFMVRSDERI